MIILLSITLAVAILAVVKWISYFYGLAGMIRYMEENNMKAPTDDEIKKAIKWCAENSFNSFKLKLKFKKLS
ncbi:hypothetical protein [Clostridium beijerinckii]|uniref:hypothetical protein n=1 Tax=Clostridium beijerinckii TaxID=1520 RepID=UPI00098C8B97|nr:hypothetical protein [Clostridium beijerinckii]NRT76354.1 hypothetical protein [Clostridium beijerinckii]OOM48609.1 hypothetical protein CBEIJ_20810 [Clostridium beijerinckii]